MAAARSSPHLSNGDGRARVEPHIAERIVGHVVGDAAQRIYDRGTYDEPKGFALAALAKLIEEIIDGTPHREGGADPQGESGLKCAARRRKSLR